MNSLSVFLSTIQSVLYSHINDTEFNKFGEIVGMPTTIIYSPEGELLANLYGRDHR